MSEENEPKTRCAMCEEEITEKRLKARPESPFCSECQL